MSKKLKLAILDEDLKARTIKKYDVSESGKQIKVVSGGEGHFMPSFDNDSFIELPKRLWKINLGWDRIYFVKKGAKKCINFKSGEAFGPDPEQLKRSVGSTLLNQLGQDKPPFPSWIVYLILLVVVGIAAKVFGAIP